MRRILITGAGSGIGQGLAVRLAGADRHIIATDLNRQGLDDTLQDLHQRGFQGQALTLDVTDAEAIDSVMAEAGPVDVLINCAGIQHVAPLEEFAPEKFSQLVAIMLTGTALMTRAALPGMRHNGFGRIINIGSIHSLIGSAYKSAYVAAKHGLLGFAKVVALETADTDITINTLCPSYVKTALVDKQIADQANRHGISEDQVVDEIMLKPMPKRAFITFEELAGSCEFLISDAARNITAQALALDGGWTAQ